MGLIMSALGESGTDYVSIRGEWNWLIMSALGESGADYVSIREEWNWLCQH